eukprot:1538531-Pleurochrysis_carterae.AAC.1
MWNNKCSLLNRLHHPLAVYRRTVDASLTELKKNVLLYGRLLFTMASIPPLLSDDESLVRRLRCPDSDSP